MGNRIISISRQFGSGGHEVAVKTADLLGIPAKFFTHFRISFGFSIAERINSFFVHIL